MKTLLIVIAVSLAVSTAFAQGKFSPQKITVPQTNPRIGTPSITPTRTSVAPIPPAHTSPASTPPKSSGPSGGSDGGPAPVPPSPTPPTTVGACKAGFTAQASEERCPGRGTGPAYECSPWSQPEFRDQCEGGGTFITLTASTFGFRCLS